LQLNLETAELADKHTHTHTHTHTHLAKLKSTVDRARAQKNRSNAGNDYD